MKKKPTSVPEIPKPSAAKARSTSKADAPAAPTSSKSSATEKPKPAPRKPLFEVAVDKVKKMLKSKGAAKKAAAAEPKVEVEAPTVVRRSYTRSKQEELLDVPPILLEGDEPAAAQVGGPGEKYSLGATPPEQKFSGGELPESYGTKKLFLTARDPHWLYAHWDLTREQQHALNTASSDGHLILRIFAGKIEGHPAYEIHVHPESRHWFAHVERAGNSYAAELGYYSALGKWMHVAVSSSTLTPPDAAAKEDAAEFATIPFEFPFARLMQIIEDAVRDNIPLAQAIEDLRRAGHPSLPRFAHSIHSPVIAPGPTRQWTPEQEKALAKIISIDETRRVWMGSLEITELIRRRLAHEGNTTSPVTAFGISSPGLASSPTSPFGGGTSASQSKGFWFNVNAELIIYGATEPDAKVTLGGHEIKLRSDGTFSFRFALPDGKYDLPAVAVSADGTDGRAAELKFVRETQYLGDVGATPQDPSLQPPLPDNL
jgi:hypothetical protein